MGSSLGQYLKYVFRLSVEINNEALFVFLAGENNPEEGLINKAILLESLRRIVRIYNHVTYFAINFLACIVHVLYKSRITLDEGYAPWKDMNLLASDVMMLLVEQAILLFMLHQESTNHIKDTILALRLIRTFSHTDQKALAA